MEFVQDTEIITHMPYNKRYRVIYRYDDSDELSIDFVMNFKKRFEEKDINYGNSIGDCIEKNKVVDFINALSRSVEDQIYVYITCEPLD